MKQSSPFLFPSPFDPSPFPPYVSLHSLADQKFRDHCELCQRFWSILNTNQLGISTKSNTMLFAGGPRCLSPKLLMTQYCVTAHRIARTPLAEWQEAQLSQTNCATLRFIWKCYIKLIILLTVSLWRKVERTFDIRATNNHHFRQSRPSWQQCRPRQTVEFDFVASVYGRATKSKLHEY